MDATMKYWFFLSLLLLPLVVNAGVPSHPNLIGLLELPYTWNERTLENQLLVPFGLLSAPTAESPAIKVIKNLGHVETHEWSYEELAAAVYGYRHDGEQAWYQLRISPTGEPAWIRGNKQITFHPLSELVSESLSYMTATWDKRVFGTVGDPTTDTVLPDRGEEIPVAVAGSAMFDGKLWILAVVLKESVCSSSDAPSVLKSGWVPAHSTSGELNIWFYSRGC